MKPFKKYNKDQIIEETNGGEEVYLAFLPELEKDYYGKYKPILNPCYDDTNPSFQVYYEGKSERVKHRDFGGSPDGEIYAGDCFDLVAQLHGLDVVKDFSKIMEIIINKLTLLCHILI